MSRNKKVQEDEKLITIPAFAGGRGIRHFFGTRFQELSPEVGVVDRWAPEGALRPVAVVAVKQVHGTDALVVDRELEPGARVDGGWDALVTDRPDVLLTIRTADCVPVLVHDPARRTIAAIHAGWRGAVAGILPRTLTVLQERFGSRPEDVRVAVGPSVGSCCYEVDDPVLSQVRRYDAWQSVVHDLGPNKGLLDLRGLLRLQACTAGVSEERLWTVGLCTICHPDLFYSYRRDGSAKRTMVSGIMLARRRASSGSRASSRRNIRPALAAND